MCKDPIFHAHLTISKFRRIFVCKHRTVSLGGGPELRITKVKGKDILVTGHGGP
jgi:hypothetical protein